MKSSQSSLPARLKDRSTQAAALARTAQDLLGLADVPEKPGPNHQRLSRYDLIGLVWLGAVVNCRPNQGDRVNRDRHRHRYRRHARSASRM